MDDDKLIVAAEHAGERLDQWLSGALPDLSRSRVQALIKSGDIVVDGSAVKPHLKIAEGMSVTVNLPEPEEVDLVPEDIPLDVLHEDKDVIVINKSAGMVVHPGAGHARGTLANALLFRCSDLAGIGGELRPGIVHRLDKDTSGVIVVAKNEKSMTMLGDQFKHRNVTKQYTALVWGSLDPPRGRVEKSVGRSRRNRKKMAVEETGRHAITNYDTVEVLGPVSLLRVSIETGRTHQIRVHLAHVGHPIVGDSEYGRARNIKLPVMPDRQMLHAAELSFDHPENGERVTFEAPIPDDMTEVVSALRETTGEN